MNKQELIEQIKGLKNLFGNKEEYIEIDTAIKLIEQLDEPQKPVVPQFVHKYIREARECSWDFQDLFKYIDDEDSEELQKWFYHECNQETLAIAWINGYELEKEKRYRVSLKNGQPLLKAFLGNNLYFSQDIAIERYEVTRKELEQTGFGWVFDCPGIEIEEVEE